MLAVEVTAICRFNRRLGKSATGAAESIGQACRRPARVNTHESALERLGGGGGGISSEYVCCCVYGIAGKGVGGSTGGDWPGMRGKGRGPRCVGDCTLPVLDGGRAVGRGEEGSP